MTWLPHREYHLTMMVNALEKMQYPNHGDTRNYLDLDMVEREIVLTLLQRELELEKKRPAAKAV